MYAFLKIALGRPLLFDSQPPDQMEPSLARRADCRTHRRDHPACLEERRACQTAGEHKYAITFISSRAATNVIASPPPELQAR